MKQTPYLLYIAVGLVVILAVAVGWLLTAEVRGGGGAFAKNHLRTATCPGLDLRYGYDPAVFTPAPYDGHAEFPLRLNGDGFSFYGKRIRGVGKLLEQEPQSRLFDFFGSEDAEVFVQTYNLRKSYEKYEDATIKGRLALHNILTFDFIEGSSSWPTYFPELVRQGSQAQLEGWALLSSEDLFYFYAVAARPLTDAQRGACTEVLNSLEFGALLGGGGPDLGEQDDSSTSEPSQKTDGASAPESTEGE